MYISVHHPERKKLIVSFFEHVLHPDIAFGKNLERSILSEIPLDESRKQKKEPSILPKKKPNTLRIVS